MTKQRREIHYRNEIPNKTYRRRHYRHTDNAGRPRNKDNIGGSYIIDDIVMAIGNTIEKEGGSNLKVGVVERDIKDVGGTTESRMVNMHACQCVAKPAISGRKPRFDPNRPHFHINDD